jgi:hypothetical protein
VWWPANAVLPQSSSGHTELLIVNLRRSLLFVPRIIAQTVTSLVGEEDQIKWLVQFEAEPAVRRSRPVGLSMTAAEWLLNAPLVGVVSPQLRSPTGTGHANAMRGSCPSNLNDVAP